MADVILMQAYTKAELGKDDEALALLNQIRQRAFGDTAHNLSGLSGDALEDAILNERKCELLGEGMIRWDMILSGKFNERGLAVRQQMKDMIAGLKDKGYYAFANGDTISDYIWTKLVKLDSPLTYDCTDPNNPALFPGWRGQYDYTTIPAVAGKVSGTDHNLAIKGLFNYIDPNGAEAKELESEGYTKTDWANNIVTYADSYDWNILSGLTDENMPPKYYWPIPAATITASNGGITNGYGLPNPN
jgi:hypothetical protein